MDVYEVLSDIMAYEGISIAQVAKKCRLPDSTVRGIVTRKQKTVSLDVAYKLSDGLGVSLERLNGMEDPNENKEKSYYETHATDKEFENIVRKYRIISEYSPNGASVVDTVLDREYAIAEQLKEQAEYIKKHQTNTDGNNEPNIDMRLINYYYRVASAGTGQIIFDMPPTKRIEIPNTLEYKKVDYAIGVNGNSMEPTFHDGDMLLVEMTEDIEIGDIGIFRVDNESYVKKLGKTELISINPAAKNIPLNETAKCMGKVIDKMPTD